LLMKIYLGSTEFLQESLWHVYMRPLQMTLSSHPLGVEGRS